MKVPPGRILVKTKELKLGMFVEDVGRSWLTHPWPTKSKLITSRQDIQQLIEHGIQEVVVDPSRSQVPTTSDEELGISEKATREARKLKPAQMSPPERPVVIEQVERRRTPRPESKVDPASVEDELPKARQAYKKALDVTREFIQDIRAGRKIQVSKVQESIQGMIDSVFRSRGAMAALLKLKTYDEYTFTHSLNVTALAVSVGRHLRLEREALQTLGMGAIFHDVGKFLVPDHILNKPGKLTDEEFRIMKTHAPLGAEHLLENNKELTDGMIDIVRHHHERMDGSGYPDGLKAENISDFSVISAMCDVYDALSSDRVYHKGMVPHEALKVVFSLRGRHFPEAWTDRFVQCIGIYPPGTAVKMNNGEVGVVIQVNYASLVKPRLIVVLDSKGRRMAIERNVDLTEPAHHGLDIVKIMDAKALGIDPAKYFPGA